MTDIADNFLLDLGFLLREKAFAAKEQFHAAQTAEQREFHGGRRKLPRQADTSKVELSACRTRYSAGVKPPSASWGRVSL